jgi:hypothetical protein
MRVSFSRLPFVSERHALRQEDEMKCILCGDTPTQQAIYRDYQAINETPV